MNLSKNPFKKVKLLPNYYSASVSIISCSMPSVVLKLTKAVLQRQMVWGLFCSISAYISSSTDNMTNFILFRCSPQALSPEKRPIPRIRHVMRPVLPMTLFGGTCLEGGS